MNKKKISIVAVSAVVIVSLGLGFNSIFKKANTLETDNNDTVVSDQSIETGDELNTEEAKVDKTETKKRTKKIKKMKILLIHQVIQIKIVVNQQKQTVLKPKSQIMMK